MAVTTLVTNKYQGYLTPDGLSAWLEVQSDSIYIPVLLQYASTGLKHR